ncbi:MAG: multicopper oxidase domain-containing protein [Marmoricola sp.]
MPGPHWIARSLHGLRRCMPVAHPARVAVGALLLVLVGAAVVVAGGDDLPVRPAAASAAESASIVIPHGAPTKGYLTKQVRITPGAQLSVVNLDTMEHTVTSAEAGPDHKLLFDVEVPPGATVSIPAASTLASGSYDFYCRFHPSMRGTLTVSGDSGGVTPVAQDFEQPLLLPPVMTGRRVRLVERRAAVRVLPHGPRTPMWTFDGSYPGPTIRRPSGHGSTVVVLNRLPRGAGATTLHLHGGHHASKDDGQPASYLVRHGASRAYRFPLREQGRPVPGEFLWYHDHRMDHTTRNNWHGLQGMFIVDDPREQALRLPHGRHDVPLMVSDRSFTADNRLTGVRTPTMVMDHGTMAFTGPAAPPGDGSFGDHVLVNGRSAPYLHVTASRYRLRLLNASAMSAYEFALSDGRPLVQIGTGASLLPRSVVRQSILLGPGQRADVIVDFHRQSGQRVQLLSIPRTGAASTGGTGTRVGALMQFRVGSSVADRSRIPDRLVATPGLRVPRRVAKTWTFGLSHTASGASYWSINGRAYDPHRVDHRVKLGSVERWRFRNTSTMTHWVHLHEEQWHLVSRDGHAPPAYERGLTDTWRLDPGEVIEVAARFTDYTGKFMIHCHMLDHEDHGMMAQFEVVR